PVGRLDDSGCARISALAGCPLWPRHCECRLLALQEHPHPGKGECPVSCRILQSLQSHQFRQPGEQHSESRLWDATEYSRAGTGGSTGTEGSFLMAESEGAWSRRAFLKSGVTVGSLLPAASATAAADGVTALSIEQAAALIRKRAVSPVELVE